MTRSRLPEIRRARRSAAVVAALALAAVSAGSAAAAAPAMSINRRRVARAGVLATAVALVAACGLVGPRGEGPVTSESRPVGTFERVTTDNGIGVAVRIGPAGPLEVRAQRNLLSVIATDVEGDTLRIRSKGAYTATDAVEVVIVTPALRGITASGGSQATVEGLSTDLFSIDLSGGSRLTGQGAAATISLKAAGGSRATLDSLTAKSVILDVSGGASATLNASDEVSGTAAGGARATVAGGARLNVQTTGGAEVTQQ